MAAKVSTQWKKPTYDLFAISNHMGGVGGGHYIAHCLNATTKKWYRYDDSSVRAVSAADVLEKALVTPSAYVLFYKRRDLPSFDDEIAQAADSEAQGSS